MWHAQIAPIPAAGYGAWIAAMQAAQGSPGDSPASGMELQSLAQYLEATKPLAALGLNH